MDVYRRQPEIVKALVLSNSVSLLLFCLRVVVTDSVQYWFLFWNLFLAWVPVVCIWFLRSKLHKQRWQQPLPLALTIAWLGFLPNSFYLISDLIHLQNTGDIGILFDAVMFMSFIWNGAVAGLISMVWVHRQIIKRHGHELATNCMIVVIALIGFAIYLGRTLRWNTWDILLNPAGLLFDLSERVINPLSYPQSFLTTLTFFVLIGSMYMVTWSFAKLLPEPKQH